VIETIVMGPDMWQAARRQVVTSDVEEASFFLARPHGTLLECYAMRCVEAAGFEHQTDAHIALTDGLSAELIQWAAGESACLVELHSHGGNYPACMSPTDLVGLGDWVPHVRWRLGGVPYAALVQARTSIDGLTWSGGRGPAALRGVEIKDLGLVAATGLSFERWHA
jgi:hypothetical protein